MGKKSKFMNERVSSLGVYAGSLGELNKIDLSFLNARFLKIDSPELRKFISKTSHKKFATSYATYFDEFKDKWYSEELYILVPIDLAITIEVDLLIEIQNAFLIMFPSDFRFYSEIGCQLFDDKYLYPNFSSTWGFRSTGEKIFENFMSFDKHDFSVINEFIKLYFERKESIDYLKITIASYINALFQPYINMAFVSLCISLESITDGNTELIYRIKRNCAILNGDTKERARTIFKNVPKLYDLRSKIVHGDSYDWKKVADYYPKLRSLVSRTIIELISLNIQSRQELNSILTEAGFGDKDKLVSDYKKYSLDVQCLIDVVMPVK